MITTPICDFVERYAKSNALRLHMPGHKGKSFLGLEKYDITEINGADSLYEANGIIHSSEENAGKIFGAKTFYSTEGSSLSIRAMLYLAFIYAKQQGARPLIAAARNVHKSFISAAALLDFDILWLYPKTAGSYLSCVIDATTLEAAFSNSAAKPTALYITSPDYLGNTADIKSLAAVCHKHGVLLLVDNAHGAYLKFLPKSLHPIDQGADISCDSAHKTLPALTPSAYLHIAHTAPPCIYENAKKALAMFGTTSPSYLVLQSLDMANKYLSDGYRNKLACFIQKVNELKDVLISHGYSLVGNEPLKITISAKKYGYTGTQLAEMLAANNIVCEFSDPDFVVLMLTPEISDEDLKILTKVLCSLPQKTEIRCAPPVLHAPERVLSVREACLSPYKALPVQKCEGKILASADVSCPPAVPIAVCGERLKKETLEVFIYYGIDTLNVIV